MNKQLYRSHEKKLLAGVCSGIAEYFEIDPTIVRIIWLLSIFAGIGIIAYLVCWLVMPEKSYKTIRSSTYESSSSEPVIDKEKTRRILGLALIVFGILFMMDKFFRWFSMDIVIPLGIIAIGILVLFSARRGQK